MKAIASRILDARNTVEGKIISVLLAVLLAAMCFNVGIFTNEAAAADDETTGETSTTQTEGTTESTGTVVTAPAISQTVSENTTEPESTETPGTETPDTQAPGQDNNTGNDEGTEGDLNGTPTEGEDGDENGTEEDAMEPITFDEATGTLTMNDVPGDVKAAYTAYLSEHAIPTSSVHALVLNNVGDIAAYGNGFYTNANLTSVVVNGANSIGDHSFFKCPALTNVSLSNVASIESNAFAECDAITTVNLNGIGKLGAEAFRHDDALSSLSMNNITTIERSPFSYCVGLTSLYIDGAQSGIKNLGTSAFYGCTGLTEVTLKNMDAIGTQTFSGCTGIKTITVDNVTTTATKVFFGCTGLTSATFKNMGTIEANVLQGCTSGIDLTVDHVTTIGETAFIGAGVTTASITNVETIGKNAFASCSKLTTVSMSSITTVDQYAFYNCTGLESVTMGTVKDIKNYAFWNCSALKTIDSLSNVSGSIGGFAFYGCESLTGLTIADLTKMGYIGSNEDIMKRVQAILAGKFQLGDAASIDELQKQWEVGAVDRSDNWNAYDNGSQIVQQARWQNETNGVAEVEVDAYYTGQKQMDYIFVADLSASMAQIGGADDKNARFYEMQSKLLDMTSKLLATPGYDCRVAIVIFGGLHNGSATKDSSDFMSNADEAAKYIKALKPLNENTDYSLGLNEVLSTLQDREDTGRSISMVFLSDGRPTYDGTTSLDTAAKLAENDVKIADLAQQIKDAGVKSIYGVLHSPGTGANVQYAHNAMGAVCDEYFTSTDTDSFGEAMNAAFTNAYGNNTVEVKVNSAQFDITNIQVTAGTTEYDPAAGVIKWTLNGMPFTDHKLTYNMTLKSELANIAGTNSYNLNGESAGFTHTGGALIDFTNPGTAQLTLTRTYTPMVNAVWLDGYSDNPVIKSVRVAKDISNNDLVALQPTSPERDGYIFTGWGTPEVDNNGNKTITAQWQADGAPGPGPSDPVVLPTQPTTPQPVGTVTVGTGAGAAAGAVAAAAAAPAAAPVEDITDDATPMAQNPEGEGDESEELIIDDENPLGTFDVKHCTSHWFMLFGILLTAAYGIAVARRRSVFTNDLNDFEKSITGETAKKRGTVTVRTGSHQAI